MSRRPIAVIALMVLAGSCLVWSTARCAGAQPRTEPEPGSGKGSSLFERLGGTNGVTSLVEDLVKRVSDDSRINAFFARTDAAALKEQLTDQICALSGGPCTYGGRDMRAAHKGMGIRNADFTAFMEGFIAALHAAHVSPADEGTLVGKMLSMKADIVEVP